MSGQAVCPVCGTAVSTYGVHREAEPYTGAFPDRLYITEQHVWLSPCGCRFQVEEFVATFDDAEELVNVSGVPVDQTPVAVARRLLITASRNFTYVDTINEQLAAVWWEWGCPRDAVLVVGRARGGDTIAEQAWRRRGLPFEPYPAKWREHTDKCPDWCRPREVCVLAGPRRDEYMVSLGADRCLAFIAACAKPRCKVRALHGSHGAVHTARMAKAAGIDTRVIILDPLLRPSVADLL